MREILFRGKERETKMWVFGYFSKNSLLFSHPATIQGYKETYLVDEETVGQFTGLYDKNNKRIFEHDIVRGKLGFCGSPNIPMKEYIFEVKYSNGCFEEIYSSDYYEFEVLGNIFDNPELIENNRATS